MKPPAIRSLDTSGAGIDLPAPARPRYGLRWPVVLLVATLLGLLSSALALAVHTRAWQTGRLLAIARRPQLQLLVRLGALHARHRLAVAALPFRAAGLWRARC